MPQKKLSQEVKRKHQSKSSMKYDSVNTQRVFVKLNKTTDSDILSFLAQSENKQGLIKELLRMHMAQIGFEQTEEEE